MALRAEGKRGTLNRRRVMNTDEKEKERKSERREKEVRGRVKEREEEVKGDDGKEKVRTGEER